ncbi:MAG: hypothetical protein QXZ44_03965 [Ferroplasma sp.]
MYKIYEVPKENKDIIEKLLSDDIIGRQTITYKDGAGYGYASSYIVLIEGSGDIFPVVDKLSDGKLKSLTEKKAEALYKKLKDEQENSQAGMGFLFR